MKPEKPAKKKITDRLVRIIKNYTFIFIFLLILLIYIAILGSRGYSFNWSYFSTILSSTTCATVGIMALGMALIIITGQIDLSIGSTAVIVGALSTIVYNANGSIVLSILTAIAAGALCGTINGVLVGKAKMPPFVATLGTMMIYRSIAEYFVFKIDVNLTGSSYKYQFSTAYESAKILKYIGTGKINVGSFAIPIVAIIFIFFVLLMIFVTKCTKYGKQVYAVGSNEKSARLAGVNVDWIKVSVFIISGVASGIAGLLLLWKNTSITPGSTADSYEMYAIAAVVLGGISMVGGRGKILGVLFGALSYATIDKIISASGLDVYIQAAAQGFVLIFVVLIQTTAPIIKDRIQTYQRNARNRQLERADSSEKVG